MKNKIMQILIKKSPMIAVFGLLSFVLSRILVIGSDIISEAVDKVLEGNIINIKYLMMSTFGLIIVSFLVAYLRTIAREFYSINVQYECRDLAVKSIQGANCSKINGGYGAVINRLTSDVNDLNTLLSEILPDVISYIITIATVGISIFNIEWRIFIGIAVIFPVVVPINNFIARKINTLAKSRRVRYDELSEIVSDNIDGVEICRTYGLENILDERVNIKAAEILHNEYSRNAYQALAQFITSILKWTPSVVCSVIALNLVIADIITVGQLMAFIILFGKLSSPLSELPFRIIDAREMFVSVERINKIINVEQEAGGSYTSDKPQENSRVIDCRDITFSYDDGKEVLKDVDFTANTGEKIAIVGGSGCGKTTFFKILCGFEQPGSGEYDLLGHNFKDWNIHDARKLISFVPQNVFLFPDTIAENIAYGSNEENSEYRMNKVIAACRKAGIHDKIMSLPQGYETVIGERGATLSGGEKQRLAIARAIYKDAPIMLMDEPTSALDEDTEKIISTTLAEDVKDRTTIIIAHRLSTVKNVDMIYVMDKGTIVESGNHETLMAKCGVYTALYNSVYTNGGYNADI